MIRAIVLTSAAPLAVEMRQFGYDCVEWDEEHLRIQYRYDSDESRKIKYFLNFVLDPERRRVWLGETFAARFGDETAVSEVLVYGL